jgi:hypothetical protein
MTNRESQLLAILRIGHEASIRGAGISLSEALTRTGYRDLRSGFGPEDLLPVIKTHPTLAEAWLAYSEDKRTDGGWYLLEHGAIGRVGGSQSEMRFGSLDEAVAEYVVRELDFWAS